MEKGYAGHDIARLERGRLLSAMKMERRGETLYHYGAEQ